VKKIILVLMLAVWSWGYVDTVYVDPGATGSGNGTSWADAFTTLQAGYSESDSGYLVLAQGREVLTEGVSLNLNSYIKIEGYNGFYTLDADGTSTSCIDSVSADYITLDHIICVNAAGVGIDLSEGGLYTTISYCKIKHSGSIGINASADCIIEHCDIDTNGGVGIRGNGRFIKIQYTSVSGNVSGGIYSHNTDHHTIFCNTITGNGNYGITIDAGNVVLNNVIDGNVTGIILYSTSTSTSNTISNNRITNNTLGMDLKDMPLPNMKYNYFAGNITDTANFIFTPDTTNQFGLTDGYVGRDTLNFTLLEDAEMRLIPLTIGAE